MKVRILHCLETIGSGGVEQRRLSLGRYLSNEKYIQSLTCSKVIGDFNKRLNENGIAVEELRVMNHPFNFKYYLKLFKVIKNFKPHIIHGAVFEGVISAVIGGVFLRVPIIIIEETSEPSNRSWRGHVLFRIMSLFADKVIATSPAVYNYLTQTLRIRKRKVFMALNGVEPPDEPKDFVVNSIRQELGILSTDLVIGSVGRLLDDHKRFSDCISALPSVLKEIPNAKLLIVGDGSDKEKLQQQATDLGIRDRVVFAGYRSDIYPFYKLMNIFLLASQREGFGMVIVEAMFMGLPVVATRVGGIPSIVVENETGYLFTPGETNLLTEKVVELLKYPDLRLSMGSMGMKRANEHFTAKRYASDVESVYTELLQRTIPNYL